MRSTTGLEISPCGQVQILHIPKRFQSRPTPCTPVFTTFFCMIPVQNAALTSCVANRPEDFKTGPSQNCQSPCHCSNEYQCVFVVVLHPFGNSSSRRSQSLQILQGVQMNPIADHNLCRSPGDSTTTNTLYSCIVRNPPG